MKKLMQNNWPTRLAVLVLVPMLAFAFVGCDDDDDEYNYDPGYGIPSVPTNMNASDGLFSDYILITWDYSSRAEGYYVYRAAPGESTYAYIGSTSSDNYTDYVPLAGSSNRYSYRVSAFNSDGESNWSASNEGWRADGPTAQPTADILDIWVEHNEWAFDAYNEYKKGMRIHTHFIIQNWRERETQVVHWFYFQSGVALDDYNGRYRTLDDKVAVSKTVYPSYDSSEYGDLEVFIPYDELHLRDDQEHFLKFESAVFAASEQVAFKDDDPSQLFVIDNR